MCEDTVGARWTVGYSYGGGFIGLDAGRDGEGYILEIAKDVVVGGGDGCECGFVGDERVEELFC